MHHLRVSLHTCGNQSGETDARNQWTKERLIPARVHVANGPDLLPFGEIGALEKLTRRVAKPVTADLSASSSPHEADGHAHDENGDHEDCGGSAAVVACCCSGLMRTTTGALPF